MLVVLDVDKSLVTTETEKEKKGKTDNECKVARASVEGWFRKVCWGELNKTWAGLGQLLDKNEERKKCWSTLILNRCGGPATGEQPTGRPGPAPKGVLVINDGNLVNVECRDILREGDRRKWEKTERE
jgi:hypothetical protein